MAKGKTQKKSRRPAQKKTVRRQNRKRAGKVSNYASASETITLPDDVVQTVYYMDNIRLEQFDRLSKIAQGYQYFRINRVDMRFKPQMDTFTDSTQNTVPYFHYLIDKGNNLVPSAAGGFIQMRESGAKPIRFDDKTVTVSWKPCVSLLTQDGSQPITFGAGLIRTSPWISTNDLAGAESTMWQPSTVEHRGLVYGVEALTSVARTYSSELTVYVEFKKPLSTYAPRGDEKLVNVVKKDSSPLLPAVVAGV